MWPAGGGAAVGDNREVRISTRRIQVDFGMEASGVEDRKFLGGNPLDTRMRHL